MWVGSCVPFMSMLSRESGKEPVALSRTHIVSTIGNDVVTAADVWRRRRATTSSFQTSTSISSTARCRRFAEITWWPEALWKYPTAISSACRSSPTTFTTRSASAPTTSFTRLKVTRVTIASKGPYTLTSFLVPVAGASQLAPVNWHVCHATGTRISLVPVTGTSRF